MGTIIKPIASVSEPSQVSLSLNPNFMVVSSLVNRTYPVEIELNIINTSVDESKTVIVLKELDSQIPHEFKGTREENKINDYAYFISDDATVTAENIRNVLLNDSFFGSNFSIEILYNTSKIKIKSIGAGSRFAFSFSQLDPDFITLTGDPTSTLNNDSISRGRLGYEIEIDIYKNTGIFLGENSTPVDGQTFGEYLVSLNKSYSDVPLWFDVNSIPKVSQKFESDFLNSNDWVSSGTIQDYRLNVKRFDGVSRELFYISDVLYCLTGYKRNLEVNNMSDYVYNTKEDNIVKPLTNRPTLTHIRGQKQYFNFILADPDRKTGTGYNFGIMYKLYSQSKRLMNVVIMHEKSVKSFNIANTIELDLDAAIGDWQNIGYIEACLCRSGEQTSEPLGFSILPECLYKVKDFAFLNSLGGWDSFNFGGVEKTDFKTDTNTIFKTQTPAHSISSEIESVYSKEVTEQFTVTSSPIKKNVVDWLKEFSTSIAVYELSTKRIVIVDEFNLKPNTKDDLFTVEMKYHYSDRYNTLIA